MLKYNTENLLTLPNLSYILYISYKYSIYKKGGDYVEILLSNSSDEPIYEQITSQIKAMIMKGV